LYTSIIPELRRLRQEDHEFGTSMGYKMRSRPGKGGGESEGKSKKP
jgi:hypothetical protein